MGAPFVLRDVCGYHPSPACTNILDEAVAENTGSGVRRNLGVLRMQRLILTSYGNQRLGENPKGFPTESGTGSRRLTVMGGWVFITHIASSVVWLLGPCLCVSPQQSGPMLFPLKNKFGHHRPTFDPASKRSTPMSGPRLHSSASTLVHRNLSGQSSHTHGDTITTYASPLDVDNVSQSLESPSRGRGPCQLESDEYKTGFGLLHVCATGPQP